MHHDVACVGLTILDILGRPVEAIPEGGNVAFIDEIRLTVAGTAAGTAIDCAKLGLKTLAVGAVGADEKGDFIVDTYTRHGVETWGVKRVHGVPTSATILNIRPNGDRPALHNRGASDHLTIEEAEIAPICAGRFVHMGGSGLLAAFDGAPTAAFLKACKGHGAKVTFDLIAPNEGTLALIEPALPHVDWFMPSMEEAAFISGLDEPADIARFFLDRGVGGCVFKWGEKGSFLATADGTTRVPAFKVPVTDTTGCGDAYCAGFIAGLAEGWDVETACRLGTAASGLVATGLGSDAGIRDFDHAVEVMETYETLG